MPPPTPSAYLLDLDGTLYTGDAAVPGAVEAIARLRARRVPFRLVTNTTSRSRRMLVERLAGCGFSLEAGEIVTATRAGIAVLRGRGYQRAAPLVPAGGLGDGDGVTPGRGTSR